jgi:hypothetical protein
MKVKITFKHGYSQQTDIFTPTLHTYEVVADNACGVARLGIWCAAASRRVLLRMFL